MKRKVSIFASLSLAVIFASGCSCNGCNEEKNPNDSSSDSSGGTIVDLPTTPDIDFTDYKLAENGQTGYVIVIPEDADDCVAYAAEELQYYFQESTSAPIAIQTDAGKTLTETSKYISLGDTTLKESAGITVTREEVNLDGYKMALKGNSLIIAGYVSRGVLYGAYDFLHHAFGYECYAEDEYALDKLSTAYMPELNYTEAPSFESRNFDGQINGKPGLIAKFKLRGVGLPEQYGGDVTDDWLGGKPCECFYPIVSPDDYYDTDPDMFRSPGGQWCLTSEKLLNLATEKIIQILIDNPQNYIVNVSEEDMRGFCSCERSSLSYCGLSCKESNALYGQSGTLIRFLNQLIEKVEAWRVETCPDRYLQYCTFAYNPSTIIPPVQMNADGEYELIDASCEPHEKLYIRFAPLTQCMIHEHYVDETVCPTNKNFSQYWAGWKAITDRFMVWDYNANYRDYLSFLDTFSVVKNEYKEYADAGAVNIMIQNNSGGEMSSMDDLRNYLQAKIMWNVNVNLEELIDDFMTHYYKDAAPYMSEYLDLMRTHSATNALDMIANGGEAVAGNYGGNYYTAECWPKTVIERAYSLLEQANAACEVLDSATKKTLQDRILQESACIRFMILNNYSSYYNLNAPEYSLMIDQWERDMSYLGVNTITEKMTVADYLVKFRDKIKD